MKSPQTLVRVISAIVVLIAMAAPLHALGEAAVTTGVQAAASVQPAEATTDTPEAAEPADTPQSATTDPVTDEPTEIATATATPTPSLEGGGPRITPPPAATETATATPDASGPRTTPPVSAASEETQVPQADPVFLSTTSNANAPVQATLPPVDALPNTGFSSPTDRGGSGTELALLGSILLAVMIAAVVLRRGRHR